MRLNPQGQISIMRIGLKRNSTYRSVNYILWFDSFINKSISAVKSEIQDKIKIISKDISLIENWEGKKFFSLTFLTPNRIICLILYIYKFWRVYFMAYWILRYHQYFLLLLLLDTFEMGKTRARERASERERERERARERRWSSLFKISNCTAIRTGLRARFGAN